MKWPILLIFLASFSLNCASESDDTSNTDAGTTTEDSGTTTDSGTTGDSGTTDATPFELEDGMWLFHEGSLGSNTCGDALPNLMGDLSDLLLPLELSKSESGIILAVAEDTEFGVMQCPRTGNDFECTINYQPGMYPPDAPVQTGFKFSGTITSETTIALTYGIIVECDEGEEAQCTELAASPESMTEIPCELAISGTAIHCGPLSGPPSDTCTDLYDEGMDDDDWGDDDWDDDEHTFDECGLVWPEDPFHAAIYSFIAEYALHTGPAVGCFLDHYPDQTYGWVAIDLEEIWFLEYENYNNALEYAQAWIDANAAENGQDVFDAIETFLLVIDGDMVYGGLGFEDGGSTSPDGPNTGECDEPLSAGDDTPAGDSPFTIEDNPNTDAPGMRCMTRYVDVLGLSVYAESHLTSAQILHAAAVFAELLDNDEDGVVDDAAVYARLLEVNAMIPMFNGEDSPGFYDFASNYHGEGVSAVLYGNEVDPTQPGHWGSDATVEEIMHTINHRGHTSVYPDAFGLEPDSSLLSAAMDVARGGQFMSVPSSYPEEAWYHYDDTTCDYGCMAIEYIYWAQVSNMEILNDAQTCAGIANEWEPCSQALLESMDELVYALITDPQYMLPQNAPDGVYSPITD